MADWTSLVRWHGLVAMKFIEATLPEIRLVSLESE